TASSTLGTQHNSAAESRRNAANAIPRKWLQHSMRLSLSSYPVEDATRKFLMSTSHESSPFRLHGRTALVTGGASGIGEATVKELVRAGAFVWIADINLPAAESLAAALGSSQAIALDVTNRDSIAAAAAN